MARPQKEGIDYFPLDVDMDHDDKIQLIEAEHGVMGFGIIIKLLMKIYAEGYYYQWSEKEQLLFSKRTNVDINQVNAVINSCIKWGMFDSEVYEKHKILTSSGIQRRYVTATSRRKDVQMIREYTLIDVESASNIVIANINGVNVNSNSTRDEFMPEKTPQSKVKESKVKESTSSPPIVPPPPPPEKPKNGESRKSPISSIVEIFNNNIHPITPIESEKLLSWLDEGMSPDVVIYAINEAVLNATRNMSYIEAILRNLHGEGITTIEGVNARTRRRKKAPKKEEVKKDDKYAEFYT